MVSRHILPLLGLEEEYDGNSELGLPGSIKETQSNKRPSFQEAVINMQSLPADGLTDIKQQVIRRGLLKRRLMPGF